MHKGAQLPAQQGRDHVDREPTPSVGLERNGPPSGQRREDPRPEVAATLPQPKKTRRNVPKNSPKTQAGSGPGRRS